MIGNAEAFFIPAMHSELCPSLKARDVKGPSSDGDGDGDGAILVPMVQPIAFAQNQRDEVRIMAQAGTLAAEPGMKQQTYIAQLIAFSGQMSVPQTDVDMTQTLQAKNPMAVQQAMAVRRLTPVECERLQGFPDNYTDIKHKGKPTPDGPRYKALGNSMAVPVMHWIGKRIQEVDEICQTQKQ